MKYILDAQKLQGLLAALDSEQQRGEYMMRAAIDLCAGKGNLYVWCSNIPKPRTAAAAKADGGYTVEFEAFWLAYPKKTGKGAAFAEWKKISKGMSETSIFIACEKALFWQKKQLDWTKENGQYIPMPATYLHQRRWEDEPPKSKQGNSDTYF